MSSENTVTDRLLDDARKKTARQEKPAAGKPALIVGVIALLVSPVSILGWIVGAVAIVLGARVVKHPTAAKQGKIAVLQFHGVPDTAHNWVTTSKERFESYLKHLADNKFQVIAMRELSKYAGAEVEPANPWGIIEERQRRLAGQSP